MLDFYLKLLTRQFRQSSIRLFCVAIAIACAVTFSIGLLSDRLEQLFDLQAKEVLAADMVLQSSSELNQQQNILVFQSMANAEASGKFLLSSVKAVTNEYPLLGELQTSDELYGEIKATRSVPEKGEAWVEDRVLNELNIELNQFINVGEKSLQVTRVLVYEPDR